MDSRVWQGGASGGRSAGHRSSLRLFCRPTPRRDQKGGLFCRPTPRRGQKGGLFCRPTPRRGPKGGLFCRPTPRRGPKGGPFCRPTPRRAPKGGLFCRPTPRRGPKGGPFCRPTPRRGQKGGLFCTPPPRGAAVLALHFGLTIKRSRIHDGNPIMYPANFAGVRRRPGKFCCGGHRRLGQIRRRPQTSSVGR